MKNKSQQKEEQRGFLGSANKDPSDGQKEKEKDLVEVERDRDLPSFDRAHRGFREMGKNICLHPSSPHLDDKSTRKWKYLEEWKRMGICWDLDGGKAKDKSENSSKIGQNDPGKLKGEL
jgi:hypothetical protein